MDGWMDGWASCEAHLGHRQTDPQTQVSAARRTVWGDLLGSLCFFVCFFKYYLVFLSSSSTTDQAIASVSEFIFVRYVAKKVLKKIIEMLAREPGAMLASGHVTHERASLPTFDLSDCRSGSHFSLGSLLLPSFVGFFSLSSPLFFYSSSSSLRLLHPTRCRPYGILNAPITSETWALAQCLIVGGKR